MHLKLVALTVFFYTSLAISGCLYHMPKDYILYAGYPIHFSGAVTKILSEKGYKRSFDNEYNYIVQIEADQIVGNRFNRASATIKLIGPNLNFEKSLSKRCLTQNCSVSRVAQTLNNLLVKNKKKIPKCNE